ncbi:unnamed protein product [Darwinula stevensoni]|uniref:Cytochrome P450 n=1 Tax=Darwinula stevensoni TaxID=69355 RepID=A0A7R9AC06_9CRUS|nr:unnamed protein product [Darwinula stevensoni]CAG0899949.1 unnamed protein product [Darwinula stevensoni]
MRNYKNIVIPKGAVIQIPLYALHREPDPFPDPEEWKPERFLKGNETHDPYAYLPFGSGPRICIGQRLSLEIVHYAMLHILREMEIVKTPETPEKPGKDREMSLRLPWGQKVDAVAGPLPIVGGRPPAQGELVAFQQLRVEHGFMEECIHRKSIKSGKQPVWFTDKIKALIRDKKRKWDAYKRTGDKTDSEEYKEDHTEVEAGN